MSSKCLPIQKQFDMKTSDHMFELQWSYDMNLFPIEKKRFEKEVKSFLEELTINNKIKSLIFIFCPFDVTENLFSIWFEKFPRVNFLNFRGCQFNNSNLTSIGKELKIKIIGIEFCIFPEDVSFLSLFKKKKIQKLHLYKNNFSKKYLMKVLKKVSKMKCLNDL
eukprot:snap_masked-scaffold_24-processed-gene-4.21-mRNA-1 protein AED:1.00 eAED:1.00 QI:0/0/0/0/1/1/6/0/163